MVPTNPNDASYLRDIKGHLAQESEITLGTSSAQAITRSKLCHGVCNQRAEVLAFVEQLSVWQVMLKIFLIVRRMYFECLMYSLFIYT